MATVTRASWAQSLLQSIQAPITGVRLPRPVDALHHPMVAAVTALSVSDRHADGGPQFR